MFKLRGKWLFNTAEPLNYLQYERLFDEPYMFTTWLQSYMMVSDDATEEVIIELELVGTLNWN